MFLEYETHREQLQKFVNIRNSCWQPCKKVCRDKEKSFISVSLFACEVIDSIGHNNC